MSSEVLSEEVRVVTTAAGLQEAVAAGAPNIELRAHIDLSDSPPVAIPPPTPYLNPEPQYVLLGIAPITVKSIRGNCPKQSEEDLYAAMGLTGAPLLPFKTQQCLVVGDQRFLDTSRGGSDSESHDALLAISRLWLDGLYLRYKRSTRAGEGYNAGMISATSFSELFMTAMTLQGDADGNLDCGACGVRAGGNGLYAEGCTFSSFEGDMIIHTNVRSTTALNGCEFTDNNGHPLGVVNAMSAADGTGAMVRLERCTFSNNTGAHLLQNMKWQEGDRTVFFSDAPMHIFHNGTHFDDPSVKDFHDEVGSRTARLEDFPGDRPTLSANSDFFLEIQQILPKISRDTLASAPPVTTMSDNPAYMEVTDSLYPPSEGFSTPLIAGLTASGALLLVALAALAFCWVLRSRQRHRAQQHQTTPQEAEDSKEASKAAMGPPRANSRVSELLVSQPHPQTGNESPPHQAQLNNRSNNTFMSPSASGAAYDKTPAHAFSNSRCASDLEPSTEGCTAPPNVRPRSNTSLLLRSNVSCDPNVSNNTTVETVPGVNGVRTVALTSGSFSNAAGSTLLIPTPGPLPVENDHTQASTATDRTTGSASWLAGDRRHAWRTTTQSSISMHAIRNARMHGAAGSSAALAHTYDAQAQHWSAMQGLQGTVEATFDVTSAMTIPAPHQAGQVLDRELLENALDNISNSKKSLFLGQFEPLGAMHRRVGGQGVVQFARSTHSMEPVAIKFFLNTNAFECEEALYMREELRSMMPAISLIESNDSGVAVTPQGWRFPPFIVVERGESLDEWQRRIQPDFITVVQVLSHVAERVHTLHALGVAHRDLKPGNVLWRPLEHSWTLIDFGCAAEIGMSTRLTFSPAFAPPETLCAVHQGCTTTEADTSSDVWAMGVIAYELSTKHPPFPAMEWTHEDIHAAALGERPYPWESDVGVFRNVPELRILSAVVKGCLCRDAEQRPSAEDVLTQLNGLFDSVA